MSGSAISLLPTNYASGFTQPESWTVFRKRYLSELAAPEAEQHLRELHALAGKRKRLTLLYASKNVKRNNATVLKDLLDGSRKPPTGTGATGSRSSRRQATALRRGR